MTERRGRRLARGLCSLCVLCAVLPVSGCDRVGRSLVGYEKPFDAGSAPHLHCLMPPACDADAGPPVAFGQRATGARDLSSCGSVSMVPDCPLDAMEPTLGPGEQPDPGEGDAGADDGVEPGADAGCPAAPGVAALLALQDSVVECAELGFVLQPDPAANVVQLGGLVLDRVNLRLQASAPIEVVLHEPSLQRSSLTLSGPVRLTILRAQALRELTVRGGALNGAQPALSIEERSLEESVIGDSSERFAGSVALTRVAVTDSQLVAERVAFESVTYYDGLLDGDELFTADSELNHVELRTRVGQLAAGKLGELNVSSCGTLSLLGVEGVHSDFAPCSDGPLRIYGSNLVRGFIDGRVESEVTGYTSVRFGQRAATSLTFWTSGLHGVAFCDQAERLLLGGTARCTSCEGRALVEPGALCTPWEPAAVDGGSADPGDNFCPLFDAVEQCEVIPERERPLQGRL